MNTIKHDDVISQAAGFLASDMDGDKVMMSIESGKYFNLGEIGGRIWELIEQPKTIEQVVDALMLEYEIDKEQCETQVGAFIQSLYDNELIVVGTIQSA